MRRVLLTTALLGLTAEGALRGGSSNTNAIVARDPDSFPPSGQGK